MLKNYHTHTPRCRHAGGTEREYIEAAIAAGIRVLGFSDHVPMPQFGDTDYYSNYRMFREDLPDYIRTLTALREEYRQKIDIRIGFEAEYYPEMFENMLELLAPYPYDYLIQGQHFIDNEYDTRQYAGIRTDDEDILRQYADQTVAGMHTGVFSYLAHPDLMAYSGGEDVYRREMGKICAAALEMDMPLECNLLGVRDHRQYPCERFFRLAGEYGCRVILGMDAHDPAAFSNTEQETEALALLQRCGVESVVDDIRLHGPAARA